MNKFYKIAVTTLTTALISFSALAAPQHNGPDRYHATKPLNMQHKPHHPPHVQHPAYKNVQHNRLPDRGINKWKAQHKLPEVYKNSRYKVSSYQRHHLSKPDRNQAWYKVDGYYLLTNVKNNIIVKIVKA